MEKFWYSDNEEWASDHDEFENEEEAALEAAEVHSVEDGKAVYVFSGETPCLATAADIRIDLIAENLTSDMAEEFYERLQDGYEAEWARASAEHPEIVEPFMTLLNDCFWGKQGPPVSFTRTTEFRVVRGEDGKASVRR